MYSFFHMFCDREIKGDWGFKIFAGHRNLIDHVLSHSYESILIFVCESKSALACLRCVDFN